MLSVNYISNFLNNKQSKIGNEYFKNLNDFESKILKNDQLNVSESVSKNKNENENNQKYNSLPEDFKYFFEEDLNNFSVNKKVESKNEIFCFFSSLLVIGDSKFLFYSYKEKRDIIKELIKKMNNDLFVDDLYFKFNYTKNSLSWACAKLERIL